jgi:class 3 adenylate cyclase
MADVGATAKISGAQRAREACADVRAALDRGDLIEAFALAAAVKATGRGARELQFLKALALARMGDIEQAWALCEPLAQSGRAPSDVRALRARMIKDRAFRARGRTRTGLLRAAAEAYAAIAGAAESYFPLINAASLAYMAGDRPTARERAEEVLRVTSGETAAYWPLASRAEALLLLGRAAEAEAAMQLAVNQPDCSDGARSSTTHQFQRLGEGADFDSEALNRLVELTRPAPVCFFSGHIFQPSDNGERLLAQEIDKVLERTGIRIGYGAAAAGADTLIAERLLAHGGEVHVVLPFDLGDFVAASVKPAGEAWLPRFEALLQRAQSVRYASTMRYVGDDGQFNYGTDFAMGLARLRALHRRSDAIHLAIWDGQPSAAPAGSGRNVALWEGLGGTTHVIAPGPVAKPVYREDQAVPANTDHERSNNAIIFADFHGFSRIPEHHLPTFWREVLGRAAKVIAQPGRQVLARNSWGDALFLVLPDARSAAALAVALRDELETIDSRDLGLEQAGVRIALHLGPMYHAVDPVTGMANFFGSEVSRAARLEPVTPVNTIYATEPFAAALALAAPGAFDLRYCGNVELAKGYGISPVFRVDSSGGDDAI